MSPMTAAACSSCSTGTAAPCSTAARGVEKVERERGLLRTLLAPEGLAQRGLDGRCCGRSGIVRRMRGSAMMFGAAGMALAATATLKGTLKTLERYAAREARRGVPT